jgi:uncharacterized membrane protein YdbT with pleckstrin-like domain
MVQTIQQLLSEDEKILNQARIHPIVFAAPTTYLFIAFLAGVFFHPIMMGVIVVLTLYPAYNAYIHYTMTYLVLTDKKVLCREGWLTRDWIRMDFDKIENSYLEQPIIGRILGYSTVIVSGVGQGNIVVNRVANGDQFVKDLEAQLSDNPTKVEVVQTS